MIMYLKTLRLYIYMDHKRVRGHVYLSFAHGLWPHIFRGRGGILQFCPRDAPWLCPLFMHAWTRDYHPPLLDNAQIFTLAYDNAPGKFKSAVSIQCVMF